MDKKVFFLHTNNQKIAAGLAGAVVTTGLCIRIDDRDELHDHHESPAPIMTTMNGMSASGTNTTSQFVLFSPETFQAWTHGDALWEVRSHPDLVLTIGSPRAGAPIISGDSPT
jgi:hypothetical protein